MFKFIDLDGNPGALRLASVVAVKCLPPETNWPWRYQVMLPDNVYVLLTAADGEKLMELLP